ncbi:MAG: hypothetical protein E7374_01265 [Clostridiales bacterium]|nr:hypothetical protein [Clostridiales bacterium]
MKVYRYLTREELEFIISGRLEEIGREYSIANFHEINTHKYKDGIRYLHFFWNKDSIKLAQDLHKYDPFTYYICTFNIPSHLLIRFRGKGFYASSGYEFDREIAVEFAIPVEKFKTEFLKSYTLDTNSSASFDL